MSSEQTRLLWIGFRTLETLQEGCLAQKGATVTRAGAFEDGVAKLGHERFDVVVLSLSARGRRLAEQVGRVRGLAPTALIAAVVCDEDEVDGALRAGADDVMSLEKEGDLVCSPVLRWIDMRRRAAAKLIDLRAATKKRAGLEAEVAQLRAEVASLKRQSIRDRASGVLGRQAFILQIELATQFLARVGGTLHTIVFEMGSLPSDWGEYIVGGFMNRIGAVLSEVCGEDAIVGRVAPTRFAVAVTSGTRSDIEWMMSVCRDRLLAIELPSGDGIGVVAEAGSMRAAETDQPARRLLDCIEEELSQSRTRILRARRVVVA